MINFILAMLSNSNASCLGDHAIKLFNDKLLYGMSAVLSAKPVKYISHAYVV